MILFLHKFDQRQIVKVLYRKPLLNQEITSKILSSNSFHMLVDHLNVFFEEMSFHALCPFFLNQIVYFLLLSCMNFLYILGVIHEYILPFSKLHHIERYKHVESQYFTPKTHII